MMAELMIDAKDVTRNFTISRGMFRGKQQLKGGEWGGFDG
jgi:hypothetical protein